MKKTIKAMILIALCVMLLTFSATAFLGCKGENEEPTRDAYVQWMSYLRDDAAVDDVVIVESHNAGAIDCTLYNQEVIPLDWLNCQQGTIYDQLLYGVRSFDFRLNQLYREDVSPENDIFCVHGTGTGVLFKDAIADIKRFSDEYPSEFIIIGIILYGEQAMYSVSADAVKGIMSLLGPEQYAFPSDYTFADKTMGDLRASGKRFIINTIPEWCTVTNNNFIRNTTWSDEYNSGTTDDGKKLYDMIIERLKNAETGETISPSLNRGSGGSKNKQLPLDFMKSDRAYFTRLIEILWDTPDYLSHLNGFCIDYATFDYWQCGNALLLNVKKGLIDDQTYEIKIREKLIDTIGS